MLTLKKYRVLERMNSAGYKTHRKFAQDVGISRVWLSALLNGRETPSTDILVKMCALLECSIDDIADYPIVAAEHLTNGN